MPGLDPYGETIRIIQKAVSQTDRSWITNERAGLRSAYERHRDLWGGSERLDRSETLMVVSDPSCKHYLAVQQGRHDVTGGDLVFDSCGQLAALGARPVSLADIFTLWQIEPEIAKSAFKAMVSACRKARVSIQGGMTHSNPALLKGSYTWTCTMLGIVEPELIARPENVRERDVIIGIAAQGLHCYGYGKILALLEKRKLDLEQQIPGTNQTVADYLLLPTAFYGPALDVFRGNVGSSPPHWNAKIWRSSTAYVMEGGIFRSLSAIIPDGLKAVIDLKKWPLPPFYWLLDDVSGLNLEDMFWIFNMGIGFIWIASPVCAGHVLQALRAAFRGRGLKVRRIGRITKGLPREPKVILEGNL